MREYLFIFAMPLAALSALLGLWLIIILPWWAVWTMLIALAVLATLIAPKGRPGGLGSGR